MRTARETLPCPKTESSQVVRCNANGADLPKYREKSEPKSER
ncbi:Uncharacterised protein [Vibrio cholerae]|nr:Uncharacterised protein [Vibrio cholerae]